MKSLVIKRSIVVAGHKTSISLEDAFWEIAKARNVTLSHLVGAIDSERQHPIVGHSPLCARRLSPAAFGSKRGAHRGINFLGGGMSLVEVEGSDATQTDLRASAYRVHPH